MKRDEYMADLMELYIKKENLERELEEVDKEIEDREVEMERRCG